MLRPFPVLLCELISGRRACAVRLAAFVSVALTMATPGCGTDSFVPPPPPELSAVPDVAATKENISVVLIFARGKGDDRSTIALAARQDAGRARVGLSVEQVPTDETDANQAGLIRAAAARGASVLIVEPSPAPEVAAALEEVREKGTPALLLLNPVKSRDPSKPFKRLTFSPYTKPAHELVQAAVAEMKASNAGDDGRALVIHDRETGPAGDALAQEIRTELTKAGVKTLVDLDIDNDPDKDKAAIVAKLEEDKKITIVIATEVPAMSAALPAVEQFRATRSIAFAGCQSVDAQFNDATSVGSVGNIERNVPALGRQALRTALKLAKGESVPDLTEVPVVFQTMGTNSSKMRPSHSKPVSEPFTKSSGDK